jgi:hypothetical protein
MLQVYSCAALKVIAIDTHNMPMYAIDYTVALHIVVNVLCEGIP